MSGSDAGVGLKTNYACVYMSGLGPGGADEMPDDSPMKCNWAVSVGVKSCPGLRLTNRNPSDLYNKLGVGVGEALKLVLVQVHDEELVCGRQLHRHLGELLVEVADVTARFLTRREENERERLKKHEVMYHRGTKMENREGGVGEFDSFNKRKERHILIIWRD